MGKKTQRSPGLPDLTKMSIEEIEALLKKAQVKKERLAGQLDTFLNAANPYMETLAALNAELDRRQPKDSAEAVAADFLKVFVRQDDEVYLHSQVSKLVKGVLALNRMREEQDTDHLNLMLDLLADHAEKTKTLFNGFWEEAEGLSIRAAKFTADRAGEGTP